MSQNPSNLSGKQTALATGAAVGSGSLVMIGFVIALVAVILMNFYVEMRVNAQNEQTVTFFRFSAEQSAGKQITNAQLQPVEIPVSLAEAFGQGAVKEDSPGSGRPADGIGFKLNQAVVKGEFLRSSLFMNINSATARDSETAGLDEISLNIDSKKQPPNLRPGDRVDLWASVGSGRSSQYMRVMEYVRVVNLGERVSDSGADQNRSSSKYGAITIYVEPELSGNLLDIQDRVNGRTFDVTRRDPQDAVPRELQKGGSEEINKRVLDAFNLD